MGAPEPILHDATMRLATMPHAELTHPHMNCKEATQQLRKWLDAMKHCATYGKTLCGSSNAGRCQNRGCHYNNIYQWTNEPCEPSDEGYECTA